MSRNIGVCVVCSYWWEAEGIDSGAWNANFYHPLASLWRFVFELWYEGLCEIGKVSVRGLVGDVNLTNGYKHMHTLFVAWIDWTILGNVIVIWCNFVTISVKACDNEVFAICDLTKRNQTSDFPLDYSKVFNVKFWQKWPKFNPYVKWPSFRKSTTLGKFDAWRSSSTSGKGLSDVNLIKVALQKTVFIGEPNSVYFCQKLLNVQECR